MSRTTCVLLSLLWPALAAALPQGLRTGAAGGSARIPFERHAPFLARHAYVAQFQARAFTVGDFDRDGDPDVEVLVVDDDGFQLVCSYVAGLHRDGAGGFAGRSSWSLPVFAGPGVSMSSGDLNGDGALDLVIGVGPDLFGGGGYTVALGNGDGTFVRRYGAQRALLIGAALGQLDGDGRLDMLTMEPTGVWFHHGLGDGSFATPVQIDPEVAVLVSFGDLDGDTVEDLVVAHIGKFTTWLGNGDGTFSGPGAPVNLSSSWYSEPVLGDFDEDGILDLAWGDTGMSTVSVALGRGNGDFDPPASFGTAFQLSGIDLNALAAGDVNRDGHLDAVVVDSLGRAQLLLGTGTGVLLSGPELATGYLARRPALADVDLDGWLDLLLICGVERPSGFGEGSGLAVFPGAGGLAAARSGARHLPGAPAPDPNGTGRPSTLADADGDGVLDALVIGTNETRFHRGLGGGAFELPLASPPAFAVGQAADFDGDGLLDIVGTRPFFELALAHGDGTGAFTLGPVSPSLPGSTLHARDLDADGDLDVVVTGLSGGTSVHKNTGNGTFLQGAFFGYARASSTSLGDVDEDGVIDLLSTGYSGIDLRPGKGDGTFSTPLSLGNTSTPVNSIADLDRDGHLDLLLYQPLSADPVLRVLAGAGDGTFTPVQARRTSYGAARLSAASLRGNGRLDILLETADTGLFVHSTDARGRLLRGVGYVPPSTGSVSSADLDGDGDVDLLVGQSLLFNHLR